MSLRVNILPKTLGDAAVTSFLLIIIPIIYYFELFIVLPVYYEQWGPFYTFHFILGTFILYNICSNLVAVMICNTSIKGRILPSTLGPNWRFCAVCESVAPPRSWHCNICNVCILKRDHHCMFTSCCIGHHNYRYFIMLVFYLFIASVYASCYNINFIYEHISFDSWISVIKVVFPLATLFLEWSQSQVYIFLVLIVLIGCAFTFILLYFHFHLIVRGVVTHERGNKLSMYDRGRKQNFIDVLGDRWHLIWLSPNVRSDLPQNGIDWEVEQSDKAK